MRKFIALLLILGLLSGCSAPGSVQPTEAPNPPAIPWRALRGCLPRRCNPRNHCRGGSVTLPPKIDTIFGYYQFRARVRQGCRTLRNNFHISP